MAKNKKQTYLQVTNAGYDAFKEAHTSMDQLRLLSLNVPGHLKDAVKILLQGSDEDLEDLLPIPLLAIEDTAERGLALAKSVEAKFDFVMSLSGELLESCVGARGKYETDLKETEIALQIAKESKKTAEEQKEISKQAYEELAKSIKEAEKSYYQAMDSMPSGWTIIGMNVVEGIANSFTTVLSGVSRAVTLGLGSSGSERKIKGGQAGQNASISMLDENTIKAYGLAILLQTYTDTLVTASIDDGKLRGNLQQNADAIMYVEKQCLNILKDAGQQGKNQVSDRVIVLCNECIIVCTDLKRTSREFQIKTETQTQLLERILSLQEAVFSLAVEGKNILGSVPTEARAPNQRVMPALSDLDGSAAQQHIHNTRFKIQQASAQLEYAREMYDKSCDKLQESSQKLGEIMADIARLDLQKTDFENIKQTLIKGIKALGELREQWGKLVMFFQMISNLIKCCLSTSLRDFSSYARKSQERGLQGYPISALKKDMIYQQAFQAAKLAHVINMISATYVEVSSGHLMTRVAGLGKLHGYDPEKDMAEIQKQVADLHRGCAEAQKEIRDLVMKHRRQFDHKVETRIRNIKRELDNVLPPVSNNDTVANRSQRAVDKGIQNVRDNEIQGTKGLNPDDFV